MTPIVDMIGAFLFGGLLFLTAARLNMYVASSQQQSTFDQKAQQNCVQAGEILENDFYRMGNGLADGVTPITVAKQDSIKFLGDVDNNGSVEEVVYAIGAKSPSSNPHQKILYRKVNNLPAVSMDLGLDTLLLRYYDATGFQTATLSAIRGIKISLNVESDARNINAGGKDTVYNTVHWEQFIVPKKLYR